MMYVAIQFPGVTIIALLREENRRMTKRQVIVLPDKSLRRPTLA